MAYDVDQADWLRSLSGLGPLKQRADQERAQKDAAEARFAAGVASAKEGIRAQFDISLKTGRFSSIAVLDEEGGQLEEFDISDADRVSGFTTEYRLQMSEGLRRMEVIADQMRAERIEKLDEHGNVVTTPRLDDEGNPIMKPKLGPDGAPEVGDDGEPVMEPDAPEPVMVPLYTDEEIAEELYMPLVRERLMPESLVPGRWSKTQQMIDASDSLYRERLEQYTREAEEAESLAIEVRTGIQRIGDLAQKAAAMAGEDGELASDIIGLTTLGLTTTATVVDACSKQDLMGSSKQIIDGIGEFTAGVVAVAVGPEQGEIARNAYKGATSVAVCGLALYNGNPDEAIDALADGISASFSAATQASGNTDDKVVNAVRDCLVQGFKGAASGVRIAKHVENGDTNAIIAELSSAAQGAVSAATRIASDFQGSGGDMSAEDMEALTARINDGIALAAATAQLGNTIADAVKQKSIKGMAEEIVNGIGEVLNGVVGQVSPGAAGTVGSAYKATTKGGLVAYYLMLDPPQPERAATSLGDGLEEAIAMIDPSNPAVAKAATWVGTAFRKAATSYDVAKAIEEERYDDAVRGMSAIASGLLGTALALELPEDTEQDEEFKATMAEAVAGMDEMAGDVADTMGALKESLGDLSDEFEARVNDLMSQHAIAQLESEREKVTTLLVQVDEGGATAADNRSIEKLIAQMMRDRAMLEMAMKLTSGGMAVVEKFVAPLAVAGAAVKLAANLMAASERAMALNAWLGNQKDMHAAVSSFESSSQNFVKNQREQFSHYTIQAACDLARMIGEICKCSGIAAAAGEAVSKSAALAATAEQIAYDYYKKADLERAWRSTRKAWDHPESRKLALIARRMNPTLAKYTLAWGATVKGDVLCKSAMASCGLNELTLSQKDTNVQTVQRYLETCFSDDNVVLKKVPLVPDWAPGEITLTVRCWGTACARGQQQADLQPTWSSAIAELLGMIEQGDRRVRMLAERAAALEDVEEDPGLEAHFDSALEEFTATVERFRRVLASYKPVDSSGEPHPSMMELVERFDEEADAAVAEAGVIYADLFDPGIAQLFES